MSCWASWSFAAFVLGGAGSRASRACLRYGELASRIEAASGLGFEAFGTLRLSAACLIALWVFESGGRFLKRKFLLRRKSAVSTKGESLPLVARRLTERGNLKTRALS